MRSRDDGERLGCQAHGLPARTTTTTMTTRYSTILPSLLLTLAASCGAAEKEEYVAPVDDAKSDLVTASTEIRGSIQAGTPVRDSFVGRKFAGYLFEGTANLEVTVALDATDGTSDPVLVIYGPQRADGRWGAPVAVNDDADGRNSRIEASLPADGTYLIVAAEYSHGAGEFELRLDHPVLETPCTLMEGCAAGSYSVLSETAAGSCRPVTELYAQAVATFRARFPGYQVANQAPVTILGKFYGSAAGVDPHNSIYLAEIPVAPEREVAAVYSVFGTENGVWRIIPEATRTTAPWGSARYMTLGTINMTMQGSVPEAELLPTLQSLAGSLLDGASIDGAERSSDGSMWFFQLLVPELQELEIITKLAGDQRVIEAWPDRRIFVESPEKGWLDIVIFRSPE
jgi:hypothetical protein